jgi:tetratricopeptide (TPR) repeat protein
MFTRIPGDVGLFRAYINKTDDCQIAIDSIGFTIYPRKADGKIDYNNKEDRKEIKGHPMFERWGWTDEESSAWTEYRKKYNELYSKFSEIKDNLELQRQLEKIISEVIDYDNKHLLIERVANGINTTEPQMEIFNIRQDILKIKTPLRTIKVKYEKAIPLNAFEKNLIEKYVSLHKHTVEIKKHAEKLRKEINNLSKLLEPFWPQYYIMKEKGEKASNNVFIPPPRMKGSISDVISFKVPSLEESQKAIDDFSKYSQNFHQQILKLASQMEIVEEKQKWAQEFFDEEQHEYTDELFKEVDDLFGEIFDDTCNSLNVLSLDDEQQEFLGAFGEAMDEVSNVCDDWSAFIDKYNILMTVYNNFVRYTNGSYDDEGDEDIRINISDTIKNNPSDEDSDDMNTETIKRYESDLLLKTNTYFDTADWHIILDYYKRKFDRKNFEAALVRAFGQHPDEASLQVRKASELAEEHLYQQALDLLKKAEAQGPPHHPKLFFVKARIYRNLQSPDLAIPLYQKLIKQETAEPVDWKRDAYENLIQIYEDKKNYAECLRLSQILWAVHQDDEEIVEKVACYNHLSCNTGEAENVLIDFLSHHPKSSLCHERLGHIYFERKEYRKAISSYDKAFTSNRDEFYGAIYHKGEALMELKEYDEAAICFEQCLLFYKLGKEYHVGAAKAYEKLGMQSQVIEHFRKALAIDPDCKEAIDFLMELNKKKITS